MVLSTMVPSTNSEKLFSNLVLSKCPAVYIYTNVSNGTEVGVFLCMQSVHVSAINTGLICACLYVLANFVKSRRQIS